MTYGTLILEKGASLFLKDVSFFKRKGARRKAQRYAEGNKF
jgi:hypothetical protein